MDASAGSIVDSSGDATTDITSVGLISLTASSDINGPGEGYLDLAADSVVEASSEDVGEIRLRGAGAIGLQSLATSDGSIDVLASGEITATLVVSGGGTDDSVTL